MRHFSVHQTKCNRVFTITHYDFGREFKQRNEHHPLSRKEDSFVWH